MARLYANSLNRAQTGQQQLKRSPQAAAQSSSCKNGEAKRSRCGGNRRHSPDGCIRQAITVPYKLYVRACDRNKKTICHVTALLNSGYSTTILHKEFAHQLGTRLNFEEGALTKLHGTKTTKMASFWLQVSPGCKHWHNVDQTKTPSKFCFGDTQLRCSDYVKQDPIFKGLDVGDYNDKVIDLLVDMNVKLLFTCAR
jgi:hypothetical protein